MNFLFWSTAKNDARVDNLFHRPAAHAAAGQGEGWCLQGMAIWLVGSLFLLFSALDMDHCSSQLKSGEHPGPSTQSIQLTPTLRLHILTVTQIGTPWRTHTRTYTCTQMVLYTLTQAYTKVNTHIIIALSLFLFRALLWYLKVEWHCSVLPFACTELNTHNYIPLSLFPALWCLKLNAQWHCSVLPFNQSSPSLYSYWGNADAEIKVPLLRTLSSHSEHRFPAPSSKNRQI